MRNVLIIDDDESVRRAFQLALEDTPCAVNVAVDGYDGLEKLRRQEVDMVYLDLKMPRMNGVETLRRIRAEGSKAPVYIVTAFAEEFMEPLRQIAEEGVDFSLARKPLSGDQIRELTAAVLGDIECRLVAKEPNDE